MNSQIENTKPTGKKNIMNRYSNIPITKKNKFKIKDYIPFSKIEEFKIPSRWGTFLLKTPQNFTKETV